MRKKFFILTVLGIALIPTFGRTIKSRSISIFQSKVPETETLADEKMEFVYDYRWCNDTTSTDGDNFKSDRMLLQIAPNGISKFSSYKNLTVDSLLMNITTEQIAEAAMEGKLSNGEFMTIFKNYPDGKMTHTEKICMDWFKYEEDMPELQWEVTDSTINILGYDCMEAKCRFRGREWRAFFTEEIPVMDGPWKLSGLPGLIMKASDIDGEYNFECIGIKSNGSRPITLYKVPYNTTDRKGFYNAKHRYDLNPYAYYETSTGNDLPVYDEYGNLCTDVYNPVALPYDYIERDWKK